MKSTKTKRKMFLIKNAEVESPFAVKFLIYVNILWKSLQGAAG
jgi:hypothetical protein